jgi:hypothetical protein
MQAAATPGTVAAAGSPAAPMKFRTARPAGGFILELPEYSASEEKTGCKLKLFVARLSVWLSSFFVEQPCWPPLAAATVLPRRT